MTAIADAMLRSGLEVAPSWLHAAAVRALQSCNCDPARAIGRFQEIVDTDLAALRVMTKRLIFDLWSEWRRPIVSVAEKPNLDVASANFLQEAA